MTAGLLARKGEALPSSFFSMPPPRLVPIAAPIVPPRPLPIPDLTVTPDISGPVEAPRHRHPETDRPHKMRVALSDAEFEKLGIAAVKHGISRHQLIREAIDTYVEKLIEAYRGSCRCIGGEGSCGAVTTCGPL
jgi:hypothetical protein